MEQQSFDKMVTNMLKDFNQAEFLHDLYHITQAPLNEHQKYISLEMMIRKEYEYKNKRVIDKLKHK
jgi:flagellar biosynthesis regulator FlbT